MTKGEGGDDVMMGDLVLTQDEVNPVMSALLDHGLEVTALHNHFFWEEPRVFFMHIHGHGKAVDLANQIQPALGLIGHGQSAHTAAAKCCIRKHGSLDTEKIAKIVGHAGEQTGSLQNNRDDLTREGATINAEWDLTLGGICWHQRLP